MHYILKNHTCDTDTCDFVLLSKKLKVQIDYLKKKYVMVFSTLLCSYRPKL